MEEKIEALIKNTIESLGYELYDVIYEKEAQDYYLRVFIDNEIGISLDDCEKVNDAITDMLDEANYIKEQYFLEISSPGLERLLRKDKHLQANIGNEVNIKLFSPITLTQNEEAEVETKNKKKSKKNKSDSQKQLSGVLKEFNKEKIVIEIEGLNQSIEIERKNISNIKLKYNW